jgi:hypothetical protein
MKPVAAFAAGLWTGAAVIAVVGLFYLRIWELNRTGNSPAGRGKLESRIELLLQEQTRAQAEETRLKQTIAEVQSRLEACLASDARRQSRLSRRETEPALEPWIVDAVVKGDESALPRLEQAAAQNNPLALDAVALLAERDNGEALTRVWNATTLNDASRQRATLLLAATVEVNAHAEELLQGIFTTPPAAPLVRESAVAGLAMPDFSTKLRQNTDVPAPPHFHPDYAQRLRLLETWRAAVTDEQLLATMDNIRARLAGRAAGEGQTP